MKTYPWLLSLTSVVMLVPAASQFACQTIECGEGSIERDGVCVPAEDGTDSVNCGPGTIVGASGLCEPELESTVCDPETTVAILDPETGVTTCYGTATGCGTRLACGTADPGRVSVCGQLYDLATDAPIQVDGTLSRRCDDPEAIQEGPCLLDIKFYDALQFAANPNTTPLTYDELFVDECGRFKATNIVRPSLGFLGIGIDDETGAPDTYRRTGTAFPVSSGQARNGEEVYVVETSDEQAWSSQAGLTAGNGFFEQGAFMVVYYDGDTPVEGVTITEAGNTEPANDFYFSDTSATTRTMIDPDLTATGINGAGIKTMSSLAEHSGTGGERDGCTWSTAQGAAIPTVIFFTTRHLEITAGMECP